MADDFDFDAWYRGALNHLRAARDLRDHNDAQLDVISHLIEHISSHPGLDVTYDVRDEPADTSDVAIRRAVAEFIGALNGSLSQLSRSLRRDEQSHP